LIFPCLQQAGLILSFDQAKERIYYDSIIRQKKEYITIVSSGKERIYYDSIIRQKKVTTKERIHI